MRYKVTFIQHVRYECNWMESLDKYLEYVVPDLPFPPYKGLTIILNRDKDLLVNLEDKITHRNGREYRTKCKIYFDYDSCSFRVYLPDETIIYSGLSNDKALADFEFIMDSYKSLGWVEVEKTK